MILEEVSVSEFQSRGFALIPQLLTPEEVRELRGVCLEFFRRNAVYLDCGITQPDAFRKIPEIRWLLADERIHDVFRRYCGSPIVYCHHSDVHLNKYTGWHKDACGHDDFTADSAESYGVYKIAFYLQEHGPQKPALSVRAGSHRTSTLHAGEIVRLHPNLGDGILFDCRISHAGEDLSVPAKVVRSLIRSQESRSRFFGGLRRLRGEPDKLAIFFTLGVPNRFLKEHVEITVRRQLTQIGESSYHLPDGIAAILKQAGVGWQEIQL